MRKFLRRICQAQGVEWPGLHPHRPRQRVRSVRRKRRGLPGPAPRTDLYSRVQKVVKPERWIPSLDQSRPFQKWAYELIGVWRNVA